MDLNRRRGHVTAELLPFRQVVRATFGSTSKERRDLEDRDYRPPKPQEPVG